MPGGGRRSCRTASRAVSLEFESPHPRSAMRISRDGLFVDNSRACRHAHGATRGFPECGVMAARLVWDQVHAGSIPVTPTQRQVRVRVPVAASGQRWCSGITVVLALEAQLAEHRPSRSADRVQVPAGAQCHLRRRGALACLERRGPSARTGGSAGEAPVGERRPRKTERAGSTPVTGSVPPKLTWSSASLVRTRLRVQLPPVAPSSSPPSCGGSSAGRARPCRGRGRGFKSRSPLRVPSSTGRAPG